MRVFPRRVVLKHFAEARSRSAVSAPSFMGLRQGQQQPYVYGRQVLTSLRAPVLVPILRKQLTPVRGERTFIAGHVPPPQRTVCQALKVVRIDPDALCVKRDHRVRQWQVGRALSRQQLRLERAASRMQCFAKAVERRLKLGIRPEDLQDLLPMQPVTRVRRQELRQLLCGTPLPAPNRPIDSGPFGSKSSQQFKSELRHCPLVGSVPVAAEDKAQSGRPQSRVDRHVAARLARPRFRVALPAASRATRLMSLPANHWSCAWISSSECPR